MTPLQKAIDIVGSQAEFARQIKAARIASGYGSKVRQQHVWKWLNHKSGTPTVPSEYCLAIETITRGEVTRYDLRPDVFGAIEKIAA